MKEVNHDKKLPTVPPFLSWLYPYKIKSLPVNTKSPAAYYLFQNKVSLTIINWLFQGMRRMDETDLVGKIIFEVILYMLFFSILDGPPLYKMTITVLLGHTTNWLVNTHFWVFGRFLGITRTSPDRFLPYIRKVVGRVNKNDSIPVIIVIGSFSRNSRFRVTSDVDIMFIKGAGFLNGVKAALVTIRERAIAFFCKFPLHLELYDCMDSMKRHKADEVPVILKDVDGEARDWYRRKGMTTRDLDE